MKARMLAGLVLVLAGVAARAAPIVTSCHGCDPPRAMRVAAAQVPLNTRQTWFDVYVVDTPGKVLRRYLVQVTREGGFPVAMAWPEAPDPTWAREFATLVDSWHAVNRLLKSVVDMPDDSPVRSATEVFNSPVAEEAVSLALNRHVMTLVGAVVTSTLKMLPRVIWSAKPYATVRFADGTTAKFEIRSLEALDSEGHVFRFEYIEGSARDSDGNPVADRVESFYGYAADYSSVYNEWLFKRQSSLFGVRVRPAASIQKKTVVCVKTESEVVCWVRDQK